jgi:hypothetical protein
MNITGFPDNIDLNPEGYRELAFVKEFRNIRSGVSLNVDEFSLVREALVRLNEWVYNEQGRFENVPVTITSDGGTIYPYYLDLQTLTLGLDRASVGVEARKSEGHFFSNADGLTFEYLRYAGGLPSTDSVYVPYLVIPDNIQALSVITSVTVLSLSYQLYNAAKQIVDVVSEAFNPLNVAVFVAQLAALVAFFAITLLALIQAVLDLKELIFPQLRRLKAYRDVDLIRRGCEFLGYTLDSTVLDLELQYMYTMGVPLAEDGKSIFQSFLPTTASGFFNKGYPTAQDTTPTLGTLIDFYLNTFNLRIFVFDGVVKIERRLDFINSANVNVIPTLSNQGAHTDEYTFNENDVWGRTYDHWLVDYTDVHSPDTDDGMKSEYVTTQINTLNPDLVRLTGLKENAAPFALGSRKNAFTDIESQMLLLFNLFDSVINVFGGNSNTASTVTERLGVLMIEKQYFSVTKKLWGLVDSNTNELRQTSDYKTRLSMDTIYTNFKTDLEVNKNNFAEKTITVPFTDDNFTSLLQNNYVNYDGYDDPVEVVSCTWFDRQYKAELTVLLPDDSAFNTQSIKIA